MQIRYSQFARLAAPALGFASIVFVTVAQPATPAKEKPAQSKSSDWNTKAHEPSITHHSVTISGKRLEYTAEAGYQPMTTETGEVTSNIFYVSYTLDSVADTSTRPITYVFNGGPGSASLWLHLGTAGPRRVVMADDGAALSPPGRLVNNEYSWLDLTDLVFIDPVGTGYSRPTKDHKQSEFSGFNEDLHSVGDFIRLFTTTRKRWSSPKFLAGESYGTTRAAGLAGYLQRRHRLDLNGIVLISSILNFQTARFTPGNDLPYILFLPTYTATAWFHHRLAPDLERDLQVTLEQARTFARTEYAQALMQGDALSDANRAEIARKLARFTGLDQKYIEQTNLRVPIQRFTKALLRDQRRTVGRLDSRFKGMDADAAGETADFDPSMAAISEPYTTAINAYLRDELGYENDIPYAVLGGRIGRWSYANVENEYLNVAETLRGVIAQNPFLKVHVAAGYYDLATPFFAAEYTFNHLGLEPELRSNITMSHYEAGHMVYINKPSLIKLKEALRAFYADATKDVAPQQP